MANGWRKNLQVVQDQAGDYWRELDRVVWPGIVYAVKDREWGRVAHKLHAFVEEWFDKMPRLNSYLFYPLLALIWWLW